MSLKLSEKSLLWPTVAMLAALAVLVGLGTWQLQRRTWKEGLIARLNERTVARAVPLDKALAIWRETGDIEYVRAEARGRFLHDKERYLYAPDQKLGPGVHVYTPLELADGALLMVNRGFVPDRLRDPKARPAGQLPGEVAVTGLLRADGEREAFTPDNDRVRNLWYWRDLGGMLGSIAGGNRQPWVPFFLEADAEPVPGGWPKGGVTLVKLPNRHLEYAFTWFGLAAALVGIYGLFAHSRLK